MANDVLADKALIKIVHTEIHRGYKISAMISRFGGLDVLVFDEADPDHAVWQGFNIISARLWLTKKIELGQITDIEAEKCRWEEFDEDMQDESDHLEKHNPKSPRLTGIYGDLERIMMENAKLVATAPSSIPEGIVLK